MNKPSWPELGVARSNEGFLVDSEISEAISKGQLITGAIEGSAKYACYEVHIGTDIQQLVLDDDPGDERDLYRVKHIGEDQQFTIKPGETFKIFAAEQLYMPADMLAITIPVGNMFKLGLNPETTFADPGFSGPFYITVCNYSTRIVTLKTGDPLARLFFFKLASRPSRIHDGSPREIPPAVHRIPRPDLTELARRDDKAIIDQVLRAVDPPHFEHAFLTNRVTQDHRASNDHALRIIRRTAAVATMFSLGAFACAAVGVTIVISRWIAATHPEYAGNLLAELTGALLVVLVVVLVWRPLRSGVMDALTTLSRNRE